MNYLREIVAFSEWKEVNPIPSSAIALWHELMSVDNRLGWKQEFTAPNEMLQLKAGLSRKQFDAARLVLIERGRIEYKKSERANKAGIYRIIPIVQNGQQKVQQDDSDCSIGTTEGTSKGTRSLNKDLNSFATDGAKAPPEQLPILTDGDVAEIEMLAVMLLQRPMLYPDEVKMLMDLSATRVPKATILQGIGESFENYKPRSSRDKINRLTYCMNHILDLHDIAQHEPQVIDTDEESKNVPRTYGRSGSRASPAHRDPEERIRIEIPEWRPPAIPSR